MKVKPMFRLVHSYTSVLITFILFVLSSCVSDEITTNIAINSEPDIEQTDNSTLPDNPAGVCYEVLDFSGVEIRFSSRF